MKRTVPESSDSLDLTTKTNRDVIRLWLALGHVIEVRSATGAWIQPSIPGGQDNWKRFLENYPPQHNSYDGWHVRIRP